ALSSKKQWTTSLIWWIIGSSGLAILHFYEGDISFGGGALFTVYVSSIFPAIFRSIARQPPGRTLTLTMLIYNIYTLAHVWVVAYAFVPAGEVLREHTDYILVSMMFTLLLGVFNARRGLTSGSPNIP